MICKEPRFLVRCLFGFHTPSSLIVHDLRVMYMTVRSCTYLHSSCHCCLLPMFPPYVTAVVEKIASLTDTVLQLYATASPSTASQESGSFEGCTVDAGYYLISLGLEGRTNLLLSLYQLMRHCKLLRVVDISRGASFLTPAADPVLEQAELPAKMRAVGPISLCGSQLSTSVSKSLCAASSGVRRALYGLFCFALAAGEAARGTFWGLLLGQRRVLMGPVSDCHNVTSLHPLSTADVTNAFMLRGVWRHCYCLAWICGLGEC